jgi:hypothetical protein
MFPSLQKIKRCLVGDRYFHMLNGVNLYARKCSTREEYLELYCSKLKEMGQYHRDVLETRILPRVNNKINGRVISFNTISFCEFSGVEEDMPHTLGDTIFLPTVFWNQPLQIQVSTMHHELIHIYQRRFPEETDRYIQDKLKYRKWGLKNMFSNIRINPDTCQSELYQKIDSGNVYAPCFKSRIPSSVNDITVKCIVGDIDGAPQLSVEYEHPYEQMAYSI